MTTAGAFATARYETERRAWIRRNRTRFLVIDAVAAAVIVAGLAARLVWPSVSWYAGVVAGMAVAFAVIARLSPPLWIEAWQVGAYGEQRTGRALAKLDDRWTVVHDRPRTFGRGNIDHVVVGPRGLYALETKNEAGEVSVDGDQLTIVRADGTVSRRGDAAARQARASAADLYRTFAAHGCSEWVMAVVVVWGDFPQRVVEGNRVTFVHGTELAGWLQDRLTRTPASSLTRARQALAGTSVGSDGWTTTGSSDWPARGRRSTTTTTARTTSAR